MSSWLSVTQKEEFQRMGALPGSRGEQVPCRSENDALVFTVAEKQSGRWFYVTLQ